MSVGIASPELQRLARTLDVDPDELDFLADLSPETLHELGEQISDGMFAAHMHQFRKLAALSGAVPSPLAAKITEMAMTPLVSARTAEVLAPERAADMIARLSADYVTEVATRINARRAKAVLAALPAAQVGQIATALALRQEWVVMGALMSYVGDEALSVAVAGLEPHHLLRIGFVVDDHTRLADVVDNLDDDGLHALFRATVEHELWVESDAVLGVLPDVQRERVRALLLITDPDVRTAYEAARVRGVLLAI